MGRLRQYLDVVRHQEHPWWFVVGRTLMALRLSPFFRIRKERFTLRFYDSSLSLALWLRPQPSLAERFFDRYLKPGDVVVDVGANVGLYSVMCATCVGDTGTVIALEPSPRIANFLRGNVAVNRLSSVRVLNVAVGDADGEICISNQSQDDQNRILQNGAGQMVPLVRLDSLDVGDRSIALLKIDVEGYEKFVLDGATGLLSRVHCIFIETWEDHFAKYGYSCVDVHARLRAAGFHLFLFQDDRLVPVPPGYVSHQCEDVVGVRDLALFSARTGFTM